jgi:hypothetical protein
MNKEQSLDDQISNFTDQILSNEENMQETAAQDELAELQKAVMRMKSAAQQARVSAGAEKRIRSRLLAEWDKNKRAERQASKGFNWNMPRLAFAGGFAVLMLLGVATLLPATEAPLTATAEGSPAWLPFLVIAGILIIVLIFWRNRHD